MRAQLNKLEGKEGRMKNSEQDQLEGYLRNM